MSSGCGTTRVASPPLAAALDVAAICSIPNSSVSCCSIISSSMALSLALVLTIALALVQALTLLLARALWYQL